MVDLFMVKKILILFSLILFQSSNLYSREFHYQVYGLNFNFMNLKFNISEKKLYSIINSKGLVGYFISFKNIIQTTNHKEQDILNYYFNLQKKNKEKIYYFKKINNQVVLSNVKFNKGKAYKVINSSDLIDITDPLTAVYKILFSNNLNSNCNTKQNIYDGDDVYQVFLTKSNLTKTFITFKNKKHSIIFTCKINYKAIAGHKFAREKNLNSMYLDVYFAKVKNDIIPVYFETKTKFITLKMYLSTVLRP